MPTFWASQIGLLANNVLPLRAGELVRTLALCRESGLRRTAVLATVGVERVFDLAVIAALQLAIASQLPDAPVARRFTLLALAILATRRASSSPCSPSRPRGAAAGDLLIRLPVLRTRGGVLIDSLRTGLAALRDRQLAAVALLWTLASWLVLAFAGWCVLQAFDLAPALARRALPARRRHVRAGRARERGLGRRVRARRALGARRLRRAARGRALGRPRPARGERPAVHRARRVGMARLGHLRPRAGPRRLRHA